MAQTCDSDIVLSDDADDLENDDDDTKGVGATRLRRLKVLYTKIKCHISVTPIASAYTKYR